MLDTEYSQDYTKNAQITHEFHIDETKRETVKQILVDLIDENKGLFLKPQRNRYKALLEEVNSACDVYITDNNYLFTIKKDDEDTIKYVIDLGLAYDLTKETNTEDLNNYLSFAFVDSNGYGVFHLNETNDYIGCFGVMDGTLVMNIWNIYKEDMYSELKQYIKEKDSNFRPLKSLKEFE